MMKNLGLAETVTPCDSTVENEVKIWRMGSLDEDKNPTCCRTFQFFPSSSTEVITCLAVNEENEVIAIGCQSGSIYLIKVFFSLSSVILRVILYVVNILNLSSYLPLNQLLLHLFVLQNHL